MMKSPRAEPVVSFTYGGFHPPKQKKTHSLTARSHGLLRRRIKLLKLIPLLLLALVLDLLLYSFTGVCPSCGSFGQFLQTPASLTGPLLASLTILIAGLTKAKN